MKARSMYIVLILIFCTVLKNNEIIAQRNVENERRPTRSVVVTRFPRERVMYVNRRIVRTPVRVLPPASVTIYNGRAKYFYHAGYYYMMKHDGYLMVAPPYGIVVTSLPPRYARVMTNTGTCLYLNGVFYKEVPNGYKTIEPPVGAKVKQLPEEAEEVTVDRKSYYEYNGILYSKVRTRDGLAYEVSGVVHD